MSYEPTNWKTGDIVTSQKLNKMESGIAGAGGVFVVKGIEDQETGYYNLDKTFAEINEAAKNGLVVLILEDPNNVTPELLIGTAVQETSNGNTYSVCFVTFTGGAQVSADIEKYMSLSANDYPKYVEE